MTKINKTHHASNNISQIQNELLIEEQNYFGSYLTVINKSPPQMGPVNQMIIESINEIPSSNPFTFPQRDLGL